MREEQFSHPNWIIWHLTFELWSSVVSPMLNKVSKAIKIHHIRITLSQFNPWISGGTRQKSLGWPPSK